MTKYLIIPLISHKLSRNHPGSTSGRQLRHHAAPGYAPPDRARSYLVNDGAAQIAAEVAESEVFLCRRRFTLPADEDKEIHNMSSSEPVIRSRQTEKEVNGVSTQVVCTEFSNYIFIVLTQYGKMGTLISVTPDTRSNDISSPAFSTKVLLGKDEPLTHVCAKNLATFVSQEAGNRPVLMGLALKDSSLDAIKQMKEIIKSCKVW
uniref:Proteasome (prosome, macropain) assembly chaperone 3 n=2 Tax=Gasterosteus aculeatus TaxID=69293 RepID=A0AAQ4RQT4_GASAC